MKKLIYSFIGLTILTGAFVVPFSPAGNSYEVRIAQAETKAEALARAEAAKNAASTELDRVKRTRDMYQGMYNQCMIETRGPSGFTNCSGQEAAYNESQKLVDEANKNYKAAYDAVEAIKKTTDDAAASAAATQANDAANSSKKLDNGGGGVYDDKVCFTLASGLSVGACFTKAMAWIAYTFLFLSSLLLGLAGLLFNAVLDFTVVHMKNNIDGLNAVGAGWKMFRDISNIIFIGVFVYAAVKTILGLASGQTKRLIVSIIIVGLLINFSLFFTKVLIDASNIISIEFFNRIARTSDFTAIGFSEQFSKPLGLPSLFDPKDFVEKSAMTGTLGLIIINGIGGTIFLLITAFTFLYASALFILRFVVLILLMILSPIAFVGFILPKTGEWSKKWWDLLSDQLVFAPLYMILIYIVLVITDNLKSQLGGGNLLAGLTPVTNAGGIIAPETMNGILSFIIIIVLLNAATVIATKVATGAGGIAGKLAGAASFGAVGLIGRNTVGRVASKLAHEDSATGNAMRKMALSGNVISRVIGRNALKATKGVANSSFDARNTGVVQSVTKSAGIQVGSGAGKGGYEGQLKKQKDETVAYVKNKEYGGASRETLKKIKTAKGEFKDAQEKLADAKRRGNAGEIALATTELEKKRGDLKKARDEKTAQIKAQRTALITQWGTKKSPSALWTKTARKYKEALAEYGVPPADKKEAAEAELNDKKEQLKSLVEMHNTAPEGDKEKINESIARIAKGIKAEDVSKLDTDVLKHDEFIKTLTVEKLKQLGKAEDKIPEDDYKFITNRIIHPDLNKPKPKVPDTASPEEKKKLQKEIDDKHRAVRKDVYKYVTNAKNDGSNPWYTDEAAALKKGKEKTTS